MKIPVPREHGAWVMLVLACTAGWFHAGGRSVATGVLALAGILLGFLAQAAWMERERAGRLWGAQLGLALVAFGAIGFGLGPGFLAVCAAVGLVGAVAQGARTGQATAGRVRLVAFGSHLAGAASLAGCAAIVAAARGAGPLRDLLPLWWNLSLVFGAGVFLVQATMPGRDRNAWGLGAVAVLAMLTLSLSPVAERFAVGMAFVPVAFRCVLVPVLRSRPIGWKRTGWLETVLGVWSVWWLG